MDLLRRFALGEIDAFETLSGSSKATFTPGLCASCAIGHRKDLTVETLWRIYRAHQQFRRTETSLLGRGGSPPTWRSTISPQTSERSLLAEPAGALRPIISSSRRLGKDPAGISRLPAKLLVRPRSLL